ncbi:peptide deformylase [Nonomuraea sp. FMUSA5-5]|uniref:Peptide deformylase n=1 Tax=Nonomuraea composti TaxID=2720023 RepID=A0ABX1BIJ4_9ACTN|nr:peptide deformylase [Nonomuraea sp. FMUSA5-5]NJP94618.1 peptide deformylase [Nonomuraea sp. FMUSA5-5]
MSGRDEPVARANRDEPVARVGRDELVERVHALLAAPRPWAVTQVGDPVLRRPAEPYDGQLPDALLRELLDAMFRHLPGVGVGLAAPQVGIPLALAVIEDPAEVPPEIAAERERVPQPPLELVNPVVTPLGSRYHAFYEGCLSVEGLTAVVPRHARVRLAACDGSGQPYEMELSGWPARIAQHETDHLNGILYLDRAEPRSLSTVANYERFSAPRHEDGR